MLAVVFGQAGDAPGLVLLGIALVASAFALGVRTGQHSPKHSLLRDRRPKDQGGCLGLLPMRCERAGPTLSPITDTRPWEGEKR
jgi:hypothetical protein